MQDRLTCWQVLEEQKKKLVIANFFEAVSLTMKKAFVFDSSLIPSLHSSLCLSSFLISLFQSYLANGNFSASLGFLSSLVSSLKKEKEAELFALLGVTKRQLFAIFDSVLKVLSVYASV